MKNGIEMTDEEQVAYAKEQDFDARLEKLRDRKDELYEKYLETFDEADEEKYNKALAAYNRLIDEAGQMESVGGKQRKKMLDLGEALIIKALQIDKDGKTIRTEDEAKSIEFIVFTLNYIMGSDNDVENPFIAQAKAKAEQRANMRKGIVKAK